VSASPASPPLGARSRSRSKTEPPPIIEATTAPNGTVCRYCAGMLPDGKQVTFCPHCGQDQTVMHCPACNAELEVGWRYCITCGRGVE
jgi:predicted amidophosphoribosyltransferase